MFLICHAYNRYLACYGICMYVWFKWIWHNLISDNHMTSLLCLTYPSIMTSLYPILIFWHIYQGSGVAEALTYEGTFAVRALTRHPNTVEASQLRLLGCDVVHGDLQDAQSLQTLMQGCYGLFLMTDSFDNDYESEMKEGRNAADAAKACGLKHIVWRYGICHIHPCIFVSFNYSQYIFWIGYT